MTKYEIIYTTNMITTFHNDYFLTVQALIKNIKQSPSPSSVSDSPSQ